MYSTFDQGEDLESEESNLICPHRGSSPKIILRNISVTIAMGELIAIVGPVGSGKSSLLASILEEMNLLSGSISVASSFKNSLAYCEQTPWVVSGTIRDNILLGSTKPFSRNDLNQAIFASGIGRDMREMKAGLHTLVGEKGKTLSGGQRARVSFARAIYSEAQLVLLDDILCAVDAHVAQHMFQEGVLKAMKGRTRLLITNQTNILPLCDKVVILNSAGEVSYFGKFAEYTGASTTTALISVDIPKQDTRQKIAPLAESIATPPSVHYVAESPSVRHKTSKESTDDREDTVTVASIADTAKSHLNDITGKSSALSFSTYWSYVTHGGVLIAVVACLFLLCAESLQICASLWLAQWGQQSYANDEDDTTFFSKELYYLHIYSALQVSSVVALSVSRLFVTSHRYNISTAFHFEMLHSIVLGQKLSFFDVTPVGKLLNRFTQDLVIVDDDLTLNIIGSSDLLVKILGTLSVIVAVTKGLALIALLPVILAFRWIYQSFVHVNATLARLEAAARSPIFVHFSQSILGLQSIRAFQCKHKFIANLELHIDKLSHVSILQQHAVQWIVLRQSFLGSLVMFAVGVIAVTVGTDILSPQYLAMALSYAIQLSNYIKSYVRQTAVTESQFVSVQRIQDCCDLKPSKKHPDIVATAIAYASPLVSAISTQSTPILEFRNAFLKYQRGPLALTDISFSVFAGQRVGVVGRTG
jgi:ABC-type multidrug transport system fused ATPase/permease subunit